GRHLRDCLGNLLFRSALHRRRHHGYRCGVDPPEDHRPHHPWHQGGSCLLSRPPRRPSCGPHREGHPVPHRRRGHAGVDAASGSAPVALREGHHHHAPHDRPHRAVDYLHPPGGSHRRVDLWLHGRTHRLLELPHFGRRHHRRAVCCLADQG